MTTVSATHLILIPAYNPGPRLAGVVAEVLRHLGVTFGVLRKEKCTGDPVRRLGNDLLFQQMAEANIEQSRNLFSYLG